MKTTNLLISALFIGIFLSSCSNLNYRINKAFNKDLVKIEGSKVIIERDIATIDFNYIDLTTPNEIVIIQDTVCKVVIHGEDNIVDEYHPTIINGVLTIPITENRIISAHEPLKYYIHVKELNGINSTDGRFTSQGMLITDSLKITGSAIFSLLIEAKYLKADLLSGRAGTYFNAGCGGWLEVKGSAEKSNIMIHDNATFDGPELTGKDMHLEFSDDGYYIIKIKNFETTNVLLPRNKVKVGYKTVLG